MAVKPEPDPLARFVRRVYPLLPVPSWGDTLELTAYHEAGHATYCELIGLPYTAIELCPPGQRLNGQVLLDNDAIESAPPVTLTEAEKEFFTCQIAAMYCAGRQAELMLLNLPRNGLVFFDDPDHRYARQRLVEQFGSATPLGYCQHLARAALSRNWCRVETLARALLKEGKIIHEKHRKNHAEQGSTDRQQARSTQTS